MTNKEIILAGRSRNCIWVSPPMNVSRGVWTIRLLDGSFPG